MNGGIAVAYSGVHQAYQLALAAQELGDSTVSIAPCSRPKVNGAEFLRG